MIFETVNERMLSNTTPNNHLIQLRDLLRCVLLHSTPQGQLHNTIVSRMCNKIGENEKHHLLSMAISMGLRLQPSLPSALQFTLTLPNDTRNSYEKMCTGYIDALLKIHDNWKKHSNGIVAVHYMLDMIGHKRYLFGMHGDMFADRSGYATYKQQVFWAEYTKWYPALRAPRYKDIPRLYSEPFFTNMHEMTCTLIQTNTYSKNSREIIYKEMNERVLQHQLVGGMSNIRSRMTRFMVYTTMLQVAIYERKQFEGDKKIEWRSNKEWLDFVNFIYENIKDANIDTNTINDAECYWCVQFKRAETACLWELYNCTKTAKEEFKQKYIECQDEIKRLFAEKTNFCAVNGTAPFDTNSMRQRYVHERNSSWDCKLFVYPPDILDAIDLLKKKRGQKHVSLVMHSSEPIMQCVADAVPLSRERAIQLSLTVSGKTIQRIAIWWGAGRQAECIESLHAASKKVMLEVKETTNITSNSNGFLTCMKQDKTNNKLKDLLHAQCHSELKTCDIIKSIFRGLVSVQVCDLFCTLASSKLKQVRINAQDLTISMNDQFMNGVINNYAQWTNRCTLPSIPPQADDHNLTQVNGFLKNIKQNQMKIINHATNKDSPNGKKLALKAFNGIMKLRREIDSLCMQHLQQWAEEVVYTTGNGEVENYGYDKNSTVIQCACASCFCRMDDFDSHALHCVTYWQKQDADMKNKEASMQRTDVLPFIFMETSYEPCTSLLYRICFVTKLQWCNGLELEDTQATVIFSPKEWRDERIKETWTVPFCLLRALPNSMPMFFLGVSTWLTIIKLKKQFEEFKIYGSFAAFYDKAICFMVHAQSVPLSHMVVMRDLFLCITWISCGHDIDIEIINNPTSTTFDKVLAQLKETSKLKDVKDEKFCFAWETGKGQTRPNVELFKVFFTYNTGEMHHTLDLNVIEHALEDEMVVKEEGALHAYHGAEHLEKEAELQIKQKTYKFRPNRIDSQYYISKQFKHVYCYSPECSLESGLNHIKLVSYTQFCNMKRDELKWRCIKCKKTGTSKSNHSHWTNQICAHFDNAATRQSESTLANSMTTAAEEYHCVMSVIIAQTAI